MPSIPASVSPTARGCSNISFCMKWLYGPSSAATPLVCTVFASLFQIGDAVGGPGERERVRGEEILAFAQADHQRIAGAGADHAVRLALRDQGDRIGAVQ